MLAYRFIGCFRTLHFLKTLQYAGRTAIIPYYKSSFKYGGAHEIRIGALIFGTSELVTPHNDTINEATLKTVNKIRLQLLLTRCE